MYVIISLVTLTIALTFQLLFGAQLQSHFQLLGSALTELVFLLIALGGGCAMILASRRHPVARDETLDLHEISALRTASPRHLAGGLLLALGGYGVTALCSGLLTTLFPEAVQSTTNRLLTVLHSQSLPLVLMGMAVIPSIAEELLFRGLIHYSFTRHTTSRYAVFATALLFASFHLSPVHFPGAFFTALLLGYALVRSTSILVPMLMHGLNNAISVLLTWYAVDLTISAPVLGLAAAALLAAGAAILEARPADALRRHWVTAAVIAGILILMTSALILL